jgi:hypothetical protein
MAKQLPGKKTISVILPEETYESVKRWADLKEWSVSKAAVKLIESGLAVESESGALTSTPKKD